MKSKSNSRKCHIYVPASFDPEQALPAELHRYADAARYFLHRIIWGDIRSQRTLDEFVPLKFEYLRTVIPDRVIKPLKTALIESGVIECDGFYVEGEKAYGYRLGAEYRSDRIARTTVDGKTAEKVRTNRRTEHKSIRLAIHRWLRSQFSRLDVEMPRALALLQNDPHFEINKIPVEQIALKDVEFSFCRMGRVHSSLTRCPKVVRPALHVCGEHLVGLDIANSQPLFLSLVVINYRKQGNRLFGKLTFKEKSPDPYADIDDIIQKTVKPFNIQKEHNNPPITSASITNRKAIVEKMEVTEDSRLTTHSDCPHDGTVINRLLADDEQQFVRLCEQGRLYETLQDWTDIPVRTWVKEELFTVLYGKNNFRSSFKMTFQELFPSVSEVIRSLKHKDHTFLSCLMQNVEAHFMIRICKTISCRFIVSDSAGLCSSIRRGICLV